MLDLGSKTGASADGRRGREAGRQAGRAGCGRVKMAKTRICGVPRIRHTPSRPQGRAKLGARQPGSLSAFCVFGGRVVVTAFSVKREQRLQID